MILQTLDLSKAFTGFGALRDVSLDVREGSIHGIIGANGRGQNDALQPALGLSRTKQRKIVFAGTDITRLDAVAVARTGIVRSFQISSIFSHLSVLDNVRVSRQSKTALPYRFWLSGSHIDGLTDRAGDPCRSRPRGPSGFARSAAFIRP